jgi:uncharacterized protein YcbX
MSYQITSLNYYPVKSLKPIAVSQVELDSFGFKYDRRFMFVGVDGKFISQRTHPKMSLMSARFNGSCLEVELVGSGVLYFQVTEFVNSARTGIWGDEVNALMLKNEGTDKISNYLGVQVSLAYMPDGLVRQVDRSYYAEDQGVSFVDGFPLLLVNEASLVELNGRLDKSVGMQRFRPNIVFAGDQAFQEDGWKRVRIGSVELDIVKPCARCGMTTIDELGVKGKEPLKTLSAYRKGVGGVYFGQNAVHKSKGQISLSDDLIVLR